MILKYVLAGGLVLGVAGLVCGRPPDDQTIQKVLGEWGALRSKSKLVRYAVAGTWEFHGEFEKPEPGSGRFVPQGPKKLSLDAVAVIDIAGNRVRIEETLPGFSQDATRWVPEFRIRTYDRNDHRTLRPRDRNEPARGPLTLGISKGNLAMEKVGSNLWPLFIAHGIVPTSGSLIRVDRFPTDHDPNDFRVVGKVTLTGRALLSLKTEPVSRTHEIWVETSGRGLVHRLTRWGDGGRYPLLRIELRYTDASTGPTLEGWTHAEYGDRGVQATMTYRVTGFERDVGVTDATFTIPAEPGMKVEEDEYPARGSGLNPNVPRSKSYVVDAGGSKTQVREERGFTNLEGEEVQPADRRLVWWTAGACVVVALVVLAILRHKRRRVVGLT